ncbi:MAG: insulinase family protein [Bacteroidales bacterium]|nr:insulinase family protein [Bacteroidales bacterium]
MKRFLLFTGIIFLVISAFTQKAVIKPEVYTLTNGLTVYLNPDANASTVFGLVVVKAGSKNDPADATGMAHYQEHMLFKGTQKIGTTDWEKEKVHIDQIFMLYDKLGITTDDNERKAIQMQINAESVEANKYVIPNELDKLLKSIGSTGMNAFTSTDMTAFFNEFPPSKIEQWLEIYSHRFMNPVFRGFQAELEVIYEEYNMYNDMFIIPLIEGFGRHFFKNHQYGQQTTIGTIDHLKNPSLTKMLTFFHTWYVPNNMALIISGNFKSNEIRPIIESKFGQWKNKPVPEFKILQEAPFNGRELVKVKMSPIKLGILGFRTVPANHPDRYALDVLYRMLSNSNQTGLLDKLALESKVMAAQALPMPYKDHGALLILIIPKIIGQSLEEAEQLVLDELKKLTEGGYAGEMFEAIKKELYVEYVTSLESHQNICVQLAQSFVNEESVDEFLSYPDIIKRLTMDDIIRVSNKYLGNNYLAFLSTMGFPKKEKIEKPGYEALKNQSTSQSDYYTELASMQSGISSPQLRDYTSEVVTIDLSNGSRMLCSNNPYNDVFSFTMRFYFTSAPDPCAEHAVRAMNMAGTLTKPVDQVKNNFANIGVTYDFSMSESFVDISLRGLEENAHTAIGYLHELLTSPSLPTSKINALYEEDKGMRKMETADAESIAEMLYEYVVYGEMSSYIDRPSLKKIKSYTPEQLMSSFADILKLPVEFHYTGNLAHQNHAVASVNELFTEFNGTKAVSLYTRTKQASQTNNLVFVHKKNTVQGKIYFYANGDKYVPETEPAADMFNLYFGGGFSGLVLKEIREYRSMAYSAGANMRRPVMNEQEYTFQGYIGTQIDKAEEAISIFMNLLRNMPENQEESQMLLEYLQLSLYSKVPGFRSVTQRYINDEWLGWNKNPLLFKQDLYRELSFKDIIVFYNDQLKTKPVTIMVVGDKKRIKPKDLEKNGTIKTVKIKQLYTK